MRILLIGSVESTLLTLNKLIEHKMDVVGVMGYRPKDVNLVSGFADLSIPARAASIPFKAFRNINEHVDEIAAYKADMIFVVGLSQLISTSILALPPLGCVGFHPTRLPAGRGRAPIAWLVLEQMSGAATFFRIGEGVDDGPIYIQHEFEITEQDDAESTCMKLSEAMNHALDSWLPELAAGKLDTHVQNHSEATWYGRRTPQDGILDWHKPVADLVRLVHATSRPHPGAFTYHENTHVIIWRASRFDDIDIKGVAGRILHTLPDGAFVVQCGDGPLRVDEFSTSHENWKPRVGMKLGYNLQLEIHSLRIQIEELTRKLDEKQ